MNHTERRRYADAMARAAAAHMADSDAQELANNLACSEPRDLENWNVYDAIRHRMDAFGVECRFPMHCALDVHEVVMAHRRKSA